MGTNIQYAKTEEETYARWLISKAISVGDCWECHLSPVQKGYCYVQVGGREGVKWRVHRLVWSVANGPIPNGKIILHSCDNRKCINPNHLVCGTDQENTDDMIAKGRKVDDPTVGYRRRLNTATRIFTLTWEGLSDAQIRDRLLISNSTLWNYRKGGYSESIFAGD